MESTSVTSFARMFLCSCVLVLASCNSNTSNTAGSAADSAGTKMRSGEGGIEQASSNASTAVKESMAKNPDSSFVAEVTVANNEEINMLQAAMDKASSKAVKDHAKMMLADHNKLKEKMSSYASKKNYPVSADDNGKAAKDMDDMKDKTGNDWDKAWLNFMYDAHEKAIGTFEGAEGHVNDPELKKMIAGTLPTLRSHRDMVKKQRDGMK